jgi:hypothetical protein
LRKLPASTPLRVLPTVASLHLDRQLADALPRAELLGPCSDEARFADLAASADLVVAIDPADRFERRALVAAGVGAAPITGNPAGPAAAVLGDEVVADLDARCLALTHVLDDPGDRSERNRRVAAACSPKAVERHLHASLRAAHE